MTSKLTKIEKTERRHNRKELLRRAQILEAMEEHGYHYDNAFHYGTERFEYLLNQPLSGELLWLDGGNSINR